MDIDRRVTVGNARHFASSPRNPPSLLVLPKLERDGAVMDATTPVAKQRAAQPGWRPDRCHRIALVLQGGGALGAYQAGVYQALHEAGIEPDWVSGVSIG